MSDDELNETFQSLDFGGASKGSRKSHRRNSKAIRSREEENEERNKIMNEVFKAGPSKKMNKDKSTQMLKTEAIKVAMIKAKQLAARAFKEDIIDQLTATVEHQPLFHAGTMLDASARVYSFRVDVTHSEACDVRMKLGDPAALKRAGDAGKHHDSDDASSSVSLDSNGDDSDGEKDSQTKDKNGKKHQAKDRAAQNESDMEDDSDNESMNNTSRELDGDHDLPSMQYDFDEDEEREMMEDLTVEQVIERASKQADEAYAANLKRRGKVSMVLTDTSDLDDREESSQFCNHLYSKATHNFDEGSTAGLLMQNVVVNRHGTRLLLHNGTNCPPDPPTPNIDAEDLIPLYGLMDDIEKEEQPDSATIFGDDFPSTSLALDATQMDETQAFLGADGNATFALDTTLAIPARCTLIRNLKDMLSNNLPATPQGVSFMSRVEIQKKLGITSKKFLAVLEESVKVVEPALYTSLVHTMFTPPRDYSLSSSAISSEYDSFIGNAVVADELELFEQSFDWVVNKIKWTDMKDSERATVLKGLADEDSQYNYFFARSDEPHFPLDEDFHGTEEDAWFWRSYSGIDQANNKVTAEDYHTLARILGGFKVNKGMSIFTRKGDALNRTLAAIPILTPARRTIRPGFNATLQQTMMTPRGPVPRRLLDIDEMAVAEALPGIGIQEDVIMEVPEDDPFLPEDDEGLGDLSAVGAELRQMPTILEESDHAMGPELLAQEGVNPSTAVGDVNFLDEGAILNTASILIADEAHWKKVKPGAENATQKQGEGEPKKKERAKVKKDQDPKNTFEWSDDDNLPLSVLKDKMNPSKRPAGLLRKESDILTAHVSRNSDMKLYMPHLFCKLSHVFMGDWGKLRMNRASSEPLEAPNHECRWMEGALRDIHTDGEMTAGKAYTEFMALFNGFFNDADERDVRAVSETQNDSSRDLFDDSTPDDDYQSCGEGGGDVVEDDVATAVQSQTAPIVPNTSSQHNKSFFSQDDSDVEDAEMFGVKYSIRQRRINAPAVKRAIGTVLCNKALDADMLNAQLGLARRLGLNGVTQLGEGDVSIVSQNGELDLSIVDSCNQLDITAEEEALQMREEEEMGEDPTNEIYKGDVRVGNVTPEGRHTFASLLVRVPDYLTGRTANDLNPINAFSVLLHMCNENNLELAQRRGPNNEVQPASMGDFTIMPSRRTLKRKHKKDGKVKE